MRWNICYIMSVHRNLSILLDWSTCLHFLFSVSLVCGLAVLSSQQLVRKAAWVAASEICSHVTCLSCSAVSRMSSRSSGSVSIRDHVHRSDHWRGLYYNIKYTSVIRSSRIHSAVVALLHLCIWSTKYVKSLGLIMYLSCMSWYLPLLSFVKEQVAKISKNSQKNLKGK